MNVNGLRSNTHRKTLFRKFKELNYDIVCLQETYITDEVVTQWKKEWGGEMLFSIGTARSKGQVILFKKNPDLIYETIHCSDRTIIVKVTLNNSQLYLCNVYAPSSENEIALYLTELSSLLDVLDTERIIICGDFNSVLDNELDIISGEKHSCRKVENFNNFIHSNDVYDAWRLNNTLDREFTWSRIINGSLIARRLDYILTSDSVIDDTLECQILSFPNSDHRGVFIKLKDFNINRGPGYWKLNNALLNEQDYLTLINNVIDVFTYEHERKGTCKELTWELLKIQIKEETMNYSKNRAMIKKNELLRLQAKLDSIDKFLANNPDSPTIISEKQRILVNLEILEYQKTKSAHTRSKVKWIQEGEKNTKFFLNLEKCRANAKIIPRLKVNENQYLNDQFSILEAQKNYYETLYSKNNELEENIEEKIDIFIENEDYPKLDINESNSCEGLVTLEELGRGLKQMKNGSSPGLDGLTTEFYKVFWGKLGNILVASFNTSFEKGSLSFSQKSAVITLIHKGKDLTKEDLSNWRPISLTNSDYKILAKTLALRLMGVLDKIIGQDQSAYVKFRSISNNLTIINDVIDYLKEKQKPGVLLAVDFSKAFDTISRKFLVSTFDRLGFGEEFIKWVSILMCENVSSIGYNGWISESFKIERGIRQGCPFSALAFIVGLELLAIKIRNNQNIQGINFRGTGDIIRIIKILLYADDVTLLLKDRNDLRLVLQILETFRKISGLTINRNKTEAMWLGSNIYNNQSFDLN